MNRYGFCKDPDCENPDEATTTTWVKYTKTLPNGGYICQACLEAWYDQDDSLNANRLDMAECGENVGEVLIR
uniref:Uncharacterized protein n=1 Tax=viral metagenome TaxID=1070528 RepID=A0A6M3LJN0_9ZZZZ